MKNYHPVSLFPISGKILERLIFNPSGLKPGDSCVSQLVRITYDMYKYFDEGHEVRDVFLDTLKVFGKVWQDGIVFKLTQDGISVNLLKILRDFLSERRQRLVLNGQAFKWTNVTAGIPKGSILFPLLFLICVNNLSQELSD